MTLTHRVICIKLVTIAVLIGLWEALAHSGLVYKGVVPPVWTVMQALIGQVLDRSFYSDLGITMLATGVGFFAGAVIAMLLAVILGTIPYFRQMLEPYIVAIGGTPKIIFLPILFMIFGLGIESKMAKGALSTFFPVVLSATSGILQIPSVLIRVGKGFDLSRWQMLTKIYLPAISNPLLTGLRLGIAMAIIGVLSGEITYSDAGLGHRLIQDAEKFRIPDVYAVTILVFAVSATINFSLVKLQDRLNRHESRRSSAATSEPRSLKWRVGNS